METNSDYALDQAKQLSDEIIAEKEKLEKVILNAFEKADAEKKRIGKFVQNLSDLLNMLRAYTSGEYRQVPWKTISFIAAAIIYFINPMDVLPDIIPGFGYLDDATVIGFVVSAVKDDLANFKAVFSKSE